MLNNARISLLNITKIGRILDIFAKFLFNGYPQVICFEKEISKFLREHKANKQNFKRQKLLNTFG